MLARPVFQGKIHCPGAKVASADSDLDNRSEPLAFFIHDGALMHLACKISDLLLLFLIEGSFILTVCNNCVAKLSAGQMMQYQPFFPGIDHCAVIQFSELGRELCFLRQFTQAFQDGIIHLFRSK